MAAPAPAPACAAPGIDDPHSASAIVADAVTGSHLLHIEGYSRTTGIPNGKFIKSRPFKVGGCHRRIAYYPNGARPSYADYVSIFVGLDEFVAEPVKAQAKFILLDQSEACRPVPGHSLTTTLNEYSDRASGFGFDAFIKRKLLEISSYLKDDCIKIRCEVTISTEIHTEDRAAEPPFVVVPPSDMHRHFGNLLATEDGADIKIKVAGETFRAHRYILAARSPVFKARLLGGMRESTATGDYIKIDDMLVQVLPSHFPTARED